MFGYGLELTALSPMPKNFTNAGYYTFFVQSSHRDSYRMCALASFLGAKESYGWEDIPQLLKYQDKAPFGYDYEALMFAADKVKNRKEKNFVGMVFTGITHEPFARTLPQFNKYEGNDWETGAKTDSLYDKFRIPLVMYAPKLLPAEKRSLTVSQLDLIPTIYALTGLHVPYTAFGRNMLDNSRRDERFAFVSEGVNIGLITPQGAVRHSGAQLLDSEAQKDTFNAQEAAEKLQALDKAAYTLLKENRWFEHE